MHHFHPFIPKHAGQQLLVLCVGAIVFVALLMAWYTPQFGSVSVLVRSEDGARALYDVSVQSGVGRVHTMSEDVTLTDSKAFTLSDTSVIMLDSAGIVKKLQESTSVLVASPVPPQPRTPLAVYGDGLKLAWINPGDGSVQVFERTERGSYAPVYINAELRPNSLVFSDDGSFVVVAKIQDAETVLYRITLDGGIMSALTTVTGFGTLIP